MKDIVIDVKRQVFEIRILILCFVLANVMNVSAIIYYDTEWRELYTQWLWMIILTAVFYVLSWIIRLPWYLYKKKK